jgi:uncharacterized protein
MTKMQPIEITRQYYLDILTSRLNEHKPLIQVLLGPRQIGKTTLALQLAESYQKEAVHYVSADLPSPPNASWIIDNWQQARATPGKLLILDEIQKIPRWSEVTKMLFDEDRRLKKYLPILILGSASLQLQAGLSESLLGRYELTHLPHWSFAECKEAFSWDLEKYLQFGGYPEPARMIADTERWQRFMLDSVIEPILGRDLPSIRPVTKPALLRQALALSLSYPAQEVSLRKLLGGLEQGGSVTTVKSYLELLEGAFLIRLIYKYSTRPLSTRTSSPKLLPLCPALISCYTTPTRIVSDATWRGRVFESTIGAKLSNIFRENFWYWRQGNHEVDFVVTWDDELYGIEVKSSQYEKLHTGLQEFKKQFNKSKLVILNQDSGKDFLSLSSIQESKEFLKRISTDISL